MSASGATVGIIANPASGKDIRRIVAHATTIDNQGKVGILRRILIGLHAAGVERILFMPDTESLGERALQGLPQRREILFITSAINMPVDGVPADSREAARRLREMDAGCMIVLGGDGTVRMVAHDVGDVPLLPISTGTNNVLPTFVEGTIAGWAAGIVARGLLPLSSVAVRHKWIQIVINTTIEECALVDVAALRGGFVGSRAIWQADDLLQVVATRADPASIGISAIAGMLCWIDPQEPLGAALWLDPTAAHQIQAAVGPGLIAPVGIADWRVIHERESVPVHDHRPLVLAYDGERERVLRQNDEALMTLRLDGPWIVDAQRVMRAWVAARS